MKPVALASLLCAALLAPESLASDSLGDRVAIYRALVRNEPLPKAPAPAGAPSDWICAPTREIPSFRHVLKRAVRDASLRYAVAPGLIHSVIRHESAYDPEVVSYAGAIGLMQLMPPTARALGVSCPTDPRQNVMGGTRYLRELHDRFGRWDDALAAYHAGPTAVEDDRLLPVTRLYVRRVMSSWRHLDAD